MLVTLNGSKASAVTTKDLTRVIKRQWREVSRNVVTPEFLKIITDMGWRYVSKKGRGGSRFERLSQSEEIRTVAIEAVRGFRGTSGVQEAFG